MGVPSPQMLPMACRVNGFEFEWEEINFFERRNAIKREKKSQVFWSVGGRFHLKKNRLTKLLSLSSFKQLSFGKQLKVGEVKFCHSVFRTWNKTSIVYNETKWDIFFISKLRKKRKIEMQIIDNSRIFPKYKSFWQKKKLRMSSS